MVHTMSFNISLSKYEFNLISNKFNIDNENYYDLSDNVNYQGVTLIYMKEKELFRKLFLHIDCIKLLGRSEITIDDLEFIENTIDIIKKDLFLYNKEIKLSRIDYRKDVYVEDLNKRKVLFNIYNKYLNKISYMNKVDVYNKYNKTSNSDFSLRYENKSKSLNIYDKEEERKARNQPVMDYEKNIIRYEAQVNTSKIKYLNKKYGIKAALKDYFNKEMYNRCMLDCIIKVVYKEDYYNQYHAFKIIDNSDYSSINKKNMKDFMLTVANKRSLDAGKEKYKNKYRKILKNLKELNINPVLIPKNTLITNIENPIKDILLE